MNSSNQLKTAVENIQDELQRILAVADLQRIEASVASEEFKTRLISEFNVKLRGLKSKVRTLNEDNAHLRKRIAELERGMLLLPESDAKRYPSNTKEKDELGPENPSLGQEIPIHEEGEQEQLDTHSGVSANHIAGLFDPHKRKRFGGMSAGMRSGKMEDNSAKSKGGETNELQVLILSSPIKSPAKSARDLTSSQFNRLPTQYSDELRDTSEARETLKRGKDTNNSDAELNLLEREVFKKVKLPLAPPDALELSPIAVAFADSQEVVADSQDEMEPLVHVPAHYTSLQRAQFLRNYLRMKLADTDFCVTLALNPITERAWMADDFKRNARWVPPAVPPSRARAMTKAQESVFREFFREAGHGARSGGPRWDDSDENEGVSDDFQDVRSQLMDKYLSPPGYMVGLFPTTQEVIDRKAEVQRKASERLARRLASALSGGEFVFYEDVLNTYVAQGRFTRDLV